MSVRVMAQVWGIPLDTSSLLVLMALADHANEDGHSVYPGNQRLGWKTALSLRQVQYNLKHLEAHGFIRREKYAKGGRGHAVEWSINIPLLETMHSAAPFSVKGAMRDRKGCNLGQERVQPTAPQPSGTINTREDFSISEENPRREGEGFRDYLARLSELVS